MFDRPAWQWHNMIFAVSIIATSLALALLFASIRQKRRPVTGRPMDDVLPTMIDLFGMWLVLSMLGYWLLNRIGAEELWRRLFG
jgi:hypothetical protein